VFFETELQPKVVNGAPRAPRARIFLPQKITPNGWSRNSCAQKISEFGFLCDAQRMLDTDLPFNNNEIVAMHHPEFIAMSPGRPDADRHALYIWAI